MEYNSAREHLILPEYGRNIQKMINFAKTVEDKEERNKVVNAIIKLMGMMNPHLRDVDDYNHKLWDHVFILSQFELDVDSPYPVPAKESFESKPERLPYPSGRIRFGHYGKTIQNMIKQVEECQEPEKKKGMATMTMNLMKRFYVIWNGETIADETIKDQFLKMCSGDLGMDLSDITLNDVKEERGNMRRSNKKNYKNNGKSNGRSNNKFKKKRN